MNMDEFAKLVLDVRTAKKIVGDVYYGPTKGEIANTQFRRSLFAVKDIKKGETVSSENVRSIRPSHGLKPVHFAQIDGKTAPKDFEYGEPITEDDLDGFN